MRYIVPFVNILFWDIWTSKLKSFVKYFIIIYNQNGLTIVNSEYGDGKRD